MLGFEHAYYTDYKDTVNAYFAQGVKECVEYAMNVSADMAQENGESPDIVAERGAQWSRLLLFSGITFVNGIDYDSISPDSIYIIYYTDVPVFEADYDLTQFYDWYVAVPR
jgi:hypothetical protein